MFKKGTILIHHKEWYLDLKHELEKYIEKIVIKIQKIENKKKYHLDFDERLLKSFFIHLDEYVQRVKEIGGFGVGYIESDLSLPEITLIDSPGSTKISNLEDAVRKHWELSSMAYVWGNFRGCIFQSAAMLEGGLKLKIMDENLDDEFKNYLKKQKSTLGTCIGFFKEKKLLPSNKIKLANDVNKLRVEHIHLLIEEKPEEAFQLTDRDEFTPLDRFKGNPPIKIKDEGISGDGVTYMIDFNKGTQGIIYKYKRDAKVCFDKSRKVLRVLYPPNVSYHQ
ncbi:MAG: hypothetical protein IMZ43_00330 [Thermoplasmata archaeon]|nr:hypothetical protein [Thermoplasmata archaeon]